MDWPSWQNIEYHKTLPKPNSKRLLSRGDRNHRFRRKRSFSSGFSWGWICRSWLVCSPAFVGSCFFGEAHVVWLCAISAGRTIRTNGFSNHFPQYPLIPFVFDRIFTWILSFQKRTNLWTANRHLHGRLYPFSTDRSRDFPPDPQP